MQPKSWPHLLRPSSKIGERLDPFAQINGYAGVRPQRQLTYDTAHPGALAAAGVACEYTLQKTSEVKSSRVLDLAALRRGELATQTVFASQPAQQIEQLYLHQTALVELKQNLAPPSPEDAMDVKVITDRPGRLAFALETNRDALLITTESFHPGWHATIDGAEVPVLRVNGDFLGVRVSAAAQRIECYFSDNWHAVGRWISLGSLGLLGLVFCLTRWRTTAPGFVR